LNTLIHELGHNIGLHHGGNSACNNKPNYNSVMNYRSQFVGTDGTCDNIGDGGSNLSIGTRIALNENALSEPAGVCGASPVDWNNNGSIQSGTIQADLNTSDSFFCGGQFTTLTDFADWENLILSSMPGRQGRPAHR